MWVYGNTIKKLHKSPQHFPFWVRLRCRATNPTLFSEREVLPEVLGTMFLIHTRHERKVQFFEARERRYYFYSQDESSAGIPKGALFLQSYPLIASFLKICLKTVRSFYGFTSIIRDDQSMTADPTSDLALAVQWRKNWLVKFNTFKTKPVTFQHYQADPEFSPVTMNGCTAEKISFFECLLGLKTQSVTRTYHVVKDAGNSLLQEV